VLIQRILTAAIFGVAVIAAILLLPSIWAGCLLGAVWLLGVREWARFAALGAGATVAYVLVSALVMFAAGQLVDTAAFVSVALALAALWWSISVLMLFNYPLQLNVPSTVCAGVMTLLPSWALLAWLHSTAERGPVLIIVLLAVVWSADTGAFFAGRAFGRHKLAPRVSPGKTWEGVIGGLVLAGVVGACAGYLTGYGPVAIGAVAVPTAAISVFGDLNVSMFKRNAGLKDSGKLLPGHGGVLDRVDSVTAAVAMFVLGLSLVGIIT
jgi:phosphatidate cytidylyltransferase